MGFLYAMLMLIHKVVQLLLQLVARLVKLAPY